MVNSNVCNMLDIKHIVITMCIQMNKLRDHILKVAREEPYMGEKIPLRWLKFEEAKGAATEPMLTMTQVITCRSLVQKQINKIN